MTLTTETCEECKTRQVEMIVQKKVCHEFVDSAGACAEHGKWVKRCQGDNRKEAARSRTPRDEEVEKITYIWHIQLENIFLIFPQNDIFSPLAEIFEMTAGPVRELFRQDIFISHMQRI